jgi:predicted Zn-dependent protease
VATPDESAVEIIYTDEGYSSHRYTAWEPVTSVPLRSEIRWVANGQPGSEQSLQRVILHELGHALGPQRHSSELQHVMATTNITDRPATDEVKLMRILFHMPARQDLSLLAAD